MRTFRSGVDYWHRNHADGQSAHVVPAALEDPSGREVPGVAIFFDRKPRVVIPADGALRMAHQLADVLEQMNAFDTEGANR